MTDTKQDLIDRYIRGEMNSDERKAFEQQLSTDEELNEMYSYTLKVSNAVKDRCEKISKIKQWEDKQNTSMKKRKFHNTILGRVFYGAVCAAAIVAVIILVNKNPKVPYIDVDKYECYRGGESVVRVASLVKDKHYEEAISLINKTEKEYKSEYDSLSLLKSNSSGEMLERIEYEEKACRIDYEEILWLKACALIGLERYGEAHVVLQELIKKKGKYSAKADSLIKELSIR